MESIKIEINNWKGAKDVDVIRTIKRALTEAAREDLFNDPDLHEATYNDYERNGVVIHFKWKQQKKGKKL